MILPTPRNDVRRQRVVAVTGALVLLVGLHSGLRSLPVPALTSSRAVIRRLDPVFVERYTAVAAPTRGGVAGPSATSDAPAGALLEEEVGSAIDALARRLGSAQGMPRTDGARAARVREAPAAGVDVAADAPRAREVFGEAGEVAAVPQPRVRPPAGRRSGGEPAGIALDVRSPQAGPGTRPEAMIEQPAAAVAVASARSAPATALAIIEREPDTFRGAEVDRLGRWMERHPADLPVGVKVHLNYRPSLLTAVAPVTSDGRDMELFLMFNRGLRELHILLVEGDRSVYLIDRGFQAQSRSLREGRVRRLDGEIVAVDSRAEAAASARAREFYNVFLSWWEVAQRDVGR